MSVHELLDVGKDNARTGKELATALHCTMRDITAAVERERREGQPICAATGENPGYYLAESAEELQAYCDSLHRRAAEMYKTRAALLNVLSQLLEKRIAENGENKNSEQ